MLTLLAPFVDIGVPKNSSRYQSLPVVSRQSSLYISIHVDILSIFKARNSQFGISRHLRSYLFIPAFFYFLPSRKCVLLQFVKPKQIPCFTAWVRGEFDAELNLTRTNNYFLILNFQQNIKQRNDNVNQEIKRNSNFSKQHQILLSQKHFGSFNNDITRYRNNVPIFKKHH